MKSIKRAIIKAVLVATTLGALYSAPAQAGGVTEVVVTPTTTMLDSKAFGELPGGFGYFTRTRVGVSEDGVSHFTLGDVTFQVGEGVGVVGEVQYTDDAHLRGGVTYATSGELGTVFAQVTSSTAGPDLEGVLSLGTSIGPVDVSNQTIVDFDGGERTYLTDRLRVGTEVGEGLEAGLAADFTEGSAAQVGVYGLHRF